MSEQQFVEAADPEEAFAAVSDSTRVAILQALWDAEDSEVPFSDLRDAVGIRDSGRFNYHLDELVGRFVTRTDDGYELTQAGRRINGAIETGAYTMDGTIDPIALDDPCPTCGGARTLRYEDETVHVECDTCPVGYRFGVPPAAFVGRAREEIPWVASQYVRTTTRQITNGFCLFCDGRVSPSVEPASDVVSHDDGDVPDEFAERADEVPLVRFTCRQCGATPTAGLPVALLDHPAVVSFFYDHGVDVQQRPVWRFADFDPDSQRLRGRDPFRASVTYEVGGDELRVVVDETLDAVDVSAER